MWDPSSIDERAACYANARQRKLKHELGVGKDGRPRDVHPGNIAFAEGLG